jgi:MoaA/NifB/PqqE/SkfB family radical SAM enzyme
MTEWRQFSTPEGLLLHDRRSGLNVLLESFKHQSFDKPLYAQIKITNKCNMHCSFCSQGSGASFEHEWTFDELFSLFKFLDQWRLTGIAVGGGEPFTFPRLAELVRKTWNETGLDVSITSNGLLITEDDLRTLAENVGEIRVSCWTPNDLRKVKRLIGKGVHIGINTILFANGMGAVKEIVNSALEIGIDDFLILQCRPLGRAGADLCPSETDFHELADYVRDLGINVKVDTGTGFKLKGLLPYTGPWSSDTAGAVICMTEDRCVAPNSFELERKVPITRFDDIKSLYEMWHG